MKIKSIILSVSILLLILCVFSCSEDDDFLKNNSKSLIVKSGFFNGNELITETDNYQLQQILSGISFQKSTALDSVLNLVDNKRIFFAQDTLGLKHYTFRITDNLSVDSLRFKNLYVLSDSNDIILSVKINHFFNDQLSFEAFNVQGTVFENIIGMQMKSNSLDDLIAQLADGCYSVTPMNLPGCGECYKTESISCPQEAVSFISSNDGDTNGGGNGNGTGNSNTGNNSNNTWWQDGGATGGDAPTGGRTITTPNTSTDIGYTVECEKVAKLFTDIDTLRTVVAANALTTNQAHENAIGFYADSTNTSFSMSGTAFSATNDNATVSIPRNPTDNYSVIHHTHNETSYTDTNGDVVQLETYSIFSWDDLLSLALHLDDDSIDASEFVFLLSTADETHYALTINDKSKFQDFFFYYTEDASPTTMIKWFEKQKKALKIQTTYYLSDKESKPIIKVDGTDNEKDLENFLKMLKDNDIGLSVFETDETFQEFENVSLDSSNKITKNKCE